MTGGRNLRTPDQLLRFEYGEVAFWCDDCGQFELDPRQAVAHAGEFGHSFHVERDWFKEDNEELFSWDHVAVAADDHTLTFGGIHAPEWIGGRSPTRWALSRVEFDSSEEAVGAGVWLVEKRPGEPDALDGDDPERVVSARLDCALAGRIVYDGCRGELRLPAAAPSPKAVGSRWDHVQVAGDRALVVYWSDAGGDVFDHVSAEWSDDVLAIGVWVRPGRGGRMSEKGNAAIVRLDRPLGARPIRQQHTTT